MYEKHEIAFAPFAPSKSADANSLSTLPLQKIVYVLCNALTLALGLWKCRSMGLLPTGTGDWLAFETRGPVSHSLDFFFCLFSLRTNDESIKKLPLRIVSLLFADDERL